MGYTPKDRFFRQAKAEGFRARSAFKLEELAARFSLFRRGQAVLDLGAAPGGFLQIILSAVGPSGTVVGIDLAAIRPLAPNVKTAVLDVLADGFDAALAELYRGPFDVVVSDLAPKTSGIRATDEARSHALAGKALTLAQTRGKKGGHFAAKLFMGGDFPAFCDDVKMQYTEMKVVRPEAVRGGSMEAYVVGLRRR